MKRIVLGVHEWVREGSLAGVKVFMAAGTLVACTSQTPQATSPVTVGAAGGPTTGEARAAEAQPLAPEPVDLVAVGRARNPSQFFDTLGTWASLPIPWQEALARYPQLQTVVRLDVPVDIAVALEPNTKRMPDIFAVFSVGVTDYAAASNALSANGERGAADQAGNQVVRLEGELECTVARANGPTSARLVCGHGLEHLAAYVATNLAQQAIGNNDVYAELRLVPIHQRYGKQAQMLKMAVPMLLREASLQNPRFDAALATAAHAVVDDALVLISELDKLTLTVDLQMDRETALTSLQLSYRGQQSFLPGLSAHSANNIGHAPPLFWSLPADNTTVSFTVASEPYARTAPVADTLGELFAGAMEHLGLATGQVDSWIVDLKTLMTTSGASVHAHIGPPAASTTPSLAEAVGYDVLGVEGESGAMLRLLDSSVKLFNDKRLRAGLSTKLGEDLKDLPTVISKAPPPSAGLPGGSRHYVLTLPPELAESLVERVVGTASGKPKAVSVSLALAQQGGKTWVVWGLEEKQVFALLKQVSEAGDSAALSTVPGLERWKTSLVNSGSSLQLKHWLSPSLFGEQLLEAQEAATLVRAMPNGGRDYIHVDWVNHSQGPRAEVRLSIPSRALTDLAAVALSLVAAR